MMMRLGTGEPGVYAESKRIPKCDGITAEKQVCRRYGRYRVGCGFYCGIHSVSQRQSEDVLQIKKRKHREPIPITLSKELHEGLVQMGMPQIVMGDGLSQLRAGQWIAKVIRDQLAVEADKRRNV